MSYKKLCITGALAQWRACLLGKLKVVSLYHQHQKKKERNYITHMQLGDNKHK